MRECPYELYVSIYEAVRNGLATGDGDIVWRVSKFIGATPGVAGLVTTLALVEAKRGDPARDKKDVCRSLSCSTRCDHRAGW